MVTQHGLAVGDKVVVLATLADPPELYCHPHTVIAKVWDAPAGALYLVENADAFEPRQFGPFTRDRLRPGW